MTHARAAVAAVLAAVVVLAGCSSEPQGENVDPDQVDSTEVPELGACRMLTPADVEQPANATRTVDCDDKHTAETFAIGELPDEFDDVEYDDGKLGEYAYRTCTEKFEKFLGATDESLVLRTIVSWAWFRPSEKAWADGARWYRCDVIGGNATSEEYRPLPRHGEGAAPRPARRPVAGLRRRRDGGRGREGPVRAGPRLAGGDAPSSSASRATSTPATRSSRVAHQGVLRQLDQGLAQLPREVRVRLHALPRGRVAGGQPALGLLGEDE